MARDREKALLLAGTAASAAAMLYVGAYQVGAVDHLVCPALGRGCEAVANASFARPFGIPDGFLAAGLLAGLGAAALAPGKLARRATVVLAALNVAANGLGLRDMSRLGTFCFWCTATAFVSPVLLTLAWRRAAAAAP